MNEIYSLLGLIIFWLTTGLGCFIVIRFLFIRLINHLGKSFKQMFILGEYIYYRKDFKLWVSDKERFPTVKEYLKKENKYYTEETLIKASKYGYQYRNDTSFPDKSFEDNCENNTKQWITTL